jgi:autotransporter-associated beta strand protein
MKHKRALFLFLQAQLLFGANPPTPSSWTNGTATAVWDTAGNWNPAVVPNAVGALAQLINGDSANPAATVSITASNTMGSMQFDRSTSYTVDSLPAATHSLIFSASSGSAQIQITVTNGSGAHVIAAPVILSSPVTITQGSTANFTISGPISENVAGKSLTKVGTGTLVLSSGAANTYSGGTIINAGTLNAISNTDNQLGAAAGNITIGSGTLQYTNGAPLITTRNFSLTGASQINTSSVPANSVTISAPAVISGLGSLEKAGVGTLILSNANTYQGGTTISGGELRISNDNQLGNTTGALHIGTATLYTTAGITSARSGSFTGAPAIFDTGGANTSTLTGNFSGVGALTLQGGGTLILTGSNSYSGGTTVTAASTLQGNTSGLQGNIHLNAATFLVFTQTTNGTYAGQISGSGSLAKDGTGQVTFTGNSSTFSGPTAVNAGTLTVTGSLASSSVTVGLGATLEGNGTVGPTINNGTISPTGGNTLSINGILTLNGTSNVLIEANPSTAGKIAVSGQANLNGAVTVNPLSGFYATSTCYTILDAAPIASAFNTVTSTDSNFVPSLITSPASVILCIRSLNPFFSFPFSNTNTEAVGNNINALNKADELSGPLLAVVDSFTGETFASINEALNQMQPANYSGFTEMQAETGGHLVSLFHRMPTLSCGCKGPNRLWLEPFGNTLTVKKHGFQTGFQANSGGIAFGYDGEVSNNFVLGLGGAWQVGRLKWHNHKGHGHFNGFYGSLYADYQIDKLYIGAVALGGADLYDVSRRLHFFTTNEHTHATYTGLDIMAQLSTAYLFGAPTAYFYPYANVDFLYLKTPTFEEEGAPGLNLKVQARASSTLRSEMGLALQVQDTNAAETMCISPQFAIGWVNMYPIERDSFIANFEGTTLLFKTKGWDQNWNLFSLDFGLSVTYYCVTSALKYNVEMSPDSKTLLFNQNGHLQIDWKW